jgi:hypothetical protein
MGQARYSGIAYTEGYNCEQKAVVRAAGTLPRQARLGID